MDREEIIKEIGDIMRESDECDRMRGFDTCDHCCHKDEKGACVFNRYIAYEIADFLISHEQNLLKEFVEWQAKQYKDLYYMYDEEIDNKKDCIDDFWWCLGRRAGIGEIRKSLKTAIERFLEERK